MRNFVAKNDFNRASVHKTEKDYSRLSAEDLKLLKEEGEAELEHNELMEDLYWAEIHQEELDAEEQYFKDMQSYFAKR